MASRALQASQVLQQSKGTTIVGTQPLENYEAALNLQLGGRDLCSLCGQELAVQVADCHRSPLVCHPVNNPLAIAGDDCNVATQLLVQGRVARVDHKRPPSQGGELLRGG